MADRGARLLVARNMEPKGEWSTRTIGDGLMSLFGAPRPLAEALGPVALRGMANAVEVSGLRAP